jgi:hypothetical protein
VKARDPAIVDLGKEDLNRRQRSDHERERKAPGFDPGDEGGEEDEDRESGVSVKPKSSCRSSNVAPKIPKPAVRICKTTASRNSAVRRMSAQRA